MIVKKMLATSLAIIASLPLLAQANKLIIHNQTNHNSTIRANGGRCSTELLGQKDGTTKKGESKTFEEWQLQLACTGHLDNCLAAVYMADNCSGDVIATVPFSVKGGILSDQIPAKQGYVINVNPSNKFEVTMSGGPN